MTTTFYRRPLPDSCIDIASSEGKARFKRALNEDTLRPFFSLISVLQPQREPAFCGLATLAMALNSLAIDPGRKWKGPWRWFSEELFDCCKSLESIEKSGISFDEFVCLARCNGAVAPLVVRGDEPGAKEKWLAALHAATETNAGERTRLVVSFSRPALGMTGDGHFALIGGFDRESASVLLLETAQFKYPQMWVEVLLLFEAMAPLDATTGRARGFAVLAPNAEPRSALQMPALKFGAMLGRLDLLQRFVRDVAQSGDDLPAYVPPELTEIANDEVERMLEEDERAPPLLAAIRATDFYRFACRESLGVALLLLVAQPRVVGARVPQLSAADRDLLDLLRVKFDAVTALEAEKTACCGVGASDGDGVAAV